MKRITGFLLVLLIALALLTGCGGKAETEELIDVPAPLYNGQPQEETQPQAVMVDGKLYYNTYQTIHIKRCGVMDGEITSSADEYSLPTENNQSNFGTGYKYQYVDAYHIDIPMENPVVWIRFCTGECKTRHNEDLCGVPTPPPDHTGSWFCIRYMPDFVTTDMATEKTYFLTADDGLFIAEVLEKGIWDTDGTADCMNNIHLTVCGTSCYYHSDCGTFNDTVNRRNLQLDSETKEKINTLLAGYIAAG